MKRPYVIYNEKCRDRSVDRGASDYHHPGHPVGFRPIVVQISLKLPETAKSREQLPFIKR